jgi:hypothetical protein
MRNTVGTDVSAVRVSRLRTLCSVRVHLCDSSSARVGSVVLKHTHVAWEAWCKCTHTWRVKRCFCVRRSRVKHGAIARTFLCLSGDSALVAATAAAELAETFTSSPQLLGTQRKSGGGKWRWCSFVVCGQLLFILVVVDIRSSAGDGLWQKQRWFLDCGQKCSNSRTRSRSEMVVVACGQWQWW